MVKITMNNSDIQLFLIPNILGNVVENTYSDWSTLVDLKESIDKFSLGTVATFILAQDTYQPSDSKLIFDALYSTFTKLDFQGEVFSKLSNECPDLALELRRTLDGKDITNDKGNIERFVTGYQEDNDNPVNDTEDTVQFYVPELLSICNNIYGVRLKAVTVSNSDKEKLCAQRDALVAIISQLSKQLNSSTLYTTEVFKTYLKVCRDLGTTK